MYIWTLKIAFFRGDTRSPPTTEGREVTGGKGEKGNGKELEEEEEEEWVECDLAVC